MLIDILRVATVLLGSCLLCGAALLVAHRMGLDRFWGRFTSGGIAPPQIIIELSALADAASKRGLLDIESAAAGSVLPLLHRGISLAIAGTVPDQVKAKLGADLDRSLLEFRWLRSALFWVSTVFLMLSVLIGTALQLVAAAGAASSTVITSIPSPLLLSVFPMFLGLACLPTLRDWASRPDAERLLAGTLIIEGVCLIGSGKDGRAVANSLGDLLPGLDQHPRTRAVAA